MKRLTYALLALSICFCLIGSSSAAFVQDISLQAVDPRIVSECVCGGLCVERVSRTGYTMNPQLLIPCPNNKHYNCYQYDYQYRREFVCNRCGRILGPEELFFRTEIDHRHF